MRSASAVLIVAALVAGWMGEVELAKFAENFGDSRPISAASFPSCRWRPRRADLAEWFWGCKRWLRLLGETLLIAYVGTLLGRDRRLLLSASSRRPTSSSRRATRFRRAARPGILPHRSGDRLRADLRDRLRPRAAARRARHRDPYHRRARQAVRRGRREHRHEAGRGRGGDRRQLVQIDPLRACCRRCCRTSSATRCCASRSTCAAPR